MQPDWLSLYLQCQRFNALLVEGGVLDQPLEAWLSLTAAGETYEQWLAERRQQQQATEMTDALLRQSVGMGRY